MNAIGRALAKGISGAATAGAGALMKDYERQQDVDAKMTLEDHAARLREALQAKQQQWASGEAELGRTAAAAEAEKGRTHTAGMQTERIASEDARAKADRESRERIAAASNAVQSQANSLSAQRLKLEEQKAQFEQSNTLDIRTKTLLSNIESRQKAIDAEINKLDPTAIDYAERLERLNQGRAALNDQFMRALPQAGGDAGGKTPVDPLDAARGAIGKVKNGK